MMSVEDSHNIHSFIITKVQLQVTKTPFGSNSIKSVLKVQTSHRCHQSAMSSCQGPVPAQRCF